MGKDTDAMDDGASSYQQLKLLASHIDERMAEMKGATEKRAEEPNDSIEFEIEKRNP